METMLQAISSLIHGGNLESVPLRRSWGLQTQCMYQRRVRCRLVLDVADVAFVLASLLQ